jgi:hypothetical protein
MRPNPDKARHAIERSRVSMQAQEDARWLASLTPEHRAFHERKPGWPCNTCIHLGIANLNASIARLHATNEARRAQGRR